MSEEARKNLTALAIAAAVMAVAAVLVLRPATVLGVGTGALADSIQDAAGSSLLYDERARCSDEGDRRFKCQVFIPVDSGGVRAEYDVRSSRFGCWSATAAQHRVGGVRPPNLDGCIWILDL